MAEPERSTRRRVVLGPAAHVLRRRVGAMAWMVLEEMAEQSDVDADAQVVAAVSVRSLAASLGVTKDTVHRATTRLRGLGAIEPHQARASNGGFAAGGYRLGIPASCLSIIDPPSPGPSQTDRSAPRRRTQAPSQTSDQLALVFEP